MRRHTVVAGIAIGVIAVSSAGTGTTRAEPLTTAGIGLASCQKLAADIRPEQGFNHLPNALVYYWVQGYMSAANITTLESDGNYIDLSKYDEKAILPALKEFCSKNPDRKPISLIDLSDRRYPQQCRTDQGRLDQGHHQMGGGLSAPQSRMKVWRRAFGPGPQKA